MDLGLSGDVLPGLGRAAGYAPQPDVAVVDADFGADLRFAPKLYVAVEVVSSTDDARVPPAGMRWTDAKTRIYQADAACEAVPAVEQHRLEARLSLRADAGWRTTALTRAEDVLFLPTCGLADLYRGTPVLRAAARP